MLQISSTPRVGRRTQKAFIDSRLRSTAKARPRKRNLYCAMVRLCDTAFAPAHRAQFRRESARLCSPSGTCAAALRKTPDPGDALASLLTSYAKRLVEWDTPWMTEDEQRQVSHCRTETTREPHHYWRRLAFAALVGRSVAAVPFRRRSEAAVHRAAVGQAYGGGPIGAGSRSSSRASRGGACTSRSTSRSSMVACETRATAYRCALFARMAANSALHCGPAGSAPKSRQCFAAVVLLNCIAGGACCRAVLPRWFSSSQSVST